MSNVKITWIELDASVLKMNPMELLYSSTQWSTKRPVDEPWLAMIKPTSSSQKYLAVTMSLDAYHKFTDSITSEFLKEIQNIIACYSEKEIEEISEEEKQKGNTGELYISKERILKLIIPSRLLNQFKIVVTSAFDRIEGDIVEKINID